MGAIRLRVQGTEWQNALRRLNNSSHVINQGFEAKQSDLRYAPDSGFVISNSYFSLALALSFASFYLIVGG